MDIAVVIAIAGAWLVVAVMGAVIAWNRGRETPQVTLFDEVAVELARHRADVLAVKDAEVTV